MGLATIINMICFVCVPAWGEWASKLAWALWWVDAAISLANNMYLPFAMYVWNAFTLGLRPRETLECPTFCSPLCLRGHTNILLI